MDEALLKLLSEHQERQTKMMDAFLSKIASLGTSSTEGKSDPQLKETVGAAIQEFHYDPDNGITFMSWHKRYEDMFLVDGKNLDESAKVRLLMQKLGPAEHTQYINYILPSHPRDFTLDATVKKLDDIFGERSSLFNIRYHCLKLNRLPDENIVSYAGRVNRECERFKLQDLKPNEFKTLIFVTGLSSANDADIRTRLLSKLDSSKDLSVQDLTTEYLRLINLKQDSHLIQVGHGIPEVASVDKISGRNSRVSSHQWNVQPLRPPSACWNCGQWHFVRFCPFRSNCCQI